jgi:2-polyprenyl-6-hydroxyphenyl methylase/3-demethylubiquinone-9 3-methyltransferase
VNIIVKSRNLFRKLIQLHAPRSIKARLWNREFLRGCWDEIYSTPGDFRYAYIEKYAHRGSILDLGCGSGNTGLELQPGSYACYVGVDISDAAIRIARERSKLADRMNNRYAQGDITEFVPVQLFDVILFRESIYYIPISKILETLRRYSHFLVPNGVIIVTLSRGPAGPQIQELIVGNFHMLEQAEGQDGSHLIVLRPPNQGAK